MHTGQPCLGRQMGCSHVHQSLQQPCISAASWLGVLLPQQSALVHLGRRSLLVAPAAKQKVEVQSLGPKPSMKLDGLIQHAQLHSRWGLCRLVQSW